MYNSTKLILKALVSDYSRKPEDKQQLENRWAGVWILTSKQRSASHPPGTAVQNNAQHQVLFSHWGGAWLLLPWALLQKGSSPTFQTKWPGQAGAVEREGL